MAGQYAAAGQIDPDGAVAILSAALTDWSWRRPRDLDAMLATIERAVHDGASGEARPWITTTASAPLDVEAAAERPEHAWVAVELAKLVEASDTERNAVARALAQKSVTLPAGAAQDLRDRVLALSDLSRSDWRQIATEERANRRAVVVADWPEVPGPGQPLDVARHLAALSGAKAPQFWRGDWYRWDGTAWAISSADLVFDQIAHYLSGCRFLDRDSEPQPWSPTPGRVDAVVRMLAGVRRRDDEEEPSEAAAVTNGHLVDLASGQPRLVPADPARFVTHRLATSWEPDATAPRWTAFLDETFRDPAAVALVQEWFGYVVTGRMDLERILSISGEKRSGKSTVAHMLSTLLGPSAVCALSLTDLTRPNGEAPLVGKRLVLFGEANWQLREGRLAVEVLKAISGRDRRTIARKYLASWEGMLPGRIMIVGNDFPSFPDESGALAGRLMHLRTAGSRYGAEDLGLRDALAAELPGILAWSMVGARRLVRQGRFAEPEAAVEARREMQVDGSKIAGWLEDRTAVSETATVDLAAAFVDYQNWARDEGVQRPCDRRWFGRLITGTPGLSTARVTIQGQQHRIVTGLRLLPVSVADPFAEPG